jgi:hypothetical protein
MAKIYPVYGGKPHGSWGERPWPRCVELLELDEFCRTDGRPTFDFPERVVVRIEASEARQHGIAIRVLCHVANQDDAAPAARVAAATAILDRGWGRPTVAITGADGGPVEMIVTGVRRAIDEGEDAPEARSIALTH